MNDGGAGYCDRADGAVALDAPALELHATDDFLGPTPQSPRMVAAAPLEAGELLARALGVLGHA